MEPPAQPLSDNLLTDLANERARSIADFMAKTGIDAARIAMGKTQTVEDSSKPPAVKLTLEAA